MKKAKVLLAIGVLASLTVVAFASKAKLQRRFYCAPKQFSLCAVPTILTATFVDQGFGIAKDTAYCSDMSLRTTCPGITLYHAL
ncbi:hypothetical protein ACE38W_01885 [Chitinophaga sp. Hz27]|uniref:hypothetical protein n=1 Tax=Chitinophaga sp. Hz27 TaxID=3347169 RepID=UPI0035D568E5